MTNWEFSERLRKEGLHNAERRKEARTVLDIKIATKRTSYWIFTEACIGGEGKISFFKSFEATTSERYDILALLLSNIETTNASSSSLRLSHFGINGFVRKPRQSSSELLSVRAKLLQPLVLQIASWKRINILFAFFAAAAPNGRQNKYKHVHNTRSLFSNRRSGEQASRYDSPIHRFISCKFMNFFVRARASNISLVHMQDETVCKMFGLWCTSWSHFRHSLTNSCAVHIPASGWSRDNKRTFQ